MVNNKTITIFMYHDIRDLHQTKYPNRYIQKSFLRVNEFNKQIKYIKKHYEIISLKNIMSVLDSKKINSNYAALTFDDGLKDHLKSTEILHDNNLIGTFFIPVKSCTEKYIMYNHKIQFIISEVDPDVIIDKIFYYLDVKNREDIWNIYSKSLWIDNHWPIKQVFITNFLRNYTNIKCKNYICDILFKEYITDNDIEFSKDFYLSVKDIKQIMETGMEIGGHGYTSQNLNNLQISEIENEISLTTNFLKNIKVNNLFFSYPNGGVNYDVIEIMKKYQYKIGLSTKNLTITDANVNRFDIPRIDAAQKLEIS